MEVGRYTAYLRHTWHDGRRVAIIGLGSFVALHMSPLIERHNSGITGMVLYQVVYEYLCTRYFMINM